MAARRDLVELLGERNVAGIRHHLVAGMREFLELLGDRGHHSRMAVPGGQHADATGKVDIALAFDVPDLGILGACGEDLRQNPNAVRSRLFFATLPLCIQAHPIHFVHLCVSSGAPNRPARASDDRVTRTDDPGSSCLRR